MSSTREKIFHICLGVLGVVSILYFSLIQQNVMFGDMKLFFLLLMSGMVMEKIHVKISEFTVTLDTAVILGAYFLLGITPTLGLIICIFGLSGLMVYKFSFQKIWTHISMFTVVFVLAHFIYEINGIVITHSHQLIDVAKYSLFGLLVFMFNWLIIWLEVRVKGSRREEINLKEPFVWDLYANLMIIPLSILLSISFERYDYSGIIVYIALMLGANLLFRVVRNLMYLNNELKIVQRVSLTITSKLNLKETTKNILEGIKQLVPCDYCTIIEFDYKNARCHTLGKKELERISIDEQDITAFMQENMEELMQEENGLILDEGHSPKVFHQFFRGMTAIKSAIYVPLVIKHDIIGCILIVSKKQKHFSEGHLGVLCTLASQAAIAIENAKMYKEAKNKATKDALTGLYNQGFFFNVLDGLTSDCSNCDRQRCHKCSPTSLIIFDIDHFKQINDTYGHQTGDMVLKDVARIIKDNVRSKDVVARYGGEEFTVILPQTIEKDAFLIADRIRCLVEEMVFYTLGGQEIHITISGGVSEFPHNADSGSTLLAYADRAMYLGSKQQGRNKVSTYVKRVV